MRSQILQRMPRGIFQKVGFCQYHQNKISLQVNSSGAFVRPCFPLVVQAHKAEAYEYVSTRNASENTNIEVFLFLCLRQRLATFVWILLLTFQCACAYCFRHECKPSSKKLSILYRIELSEVVCTNFDHRKVKLLAFQVRTKY